MSELTMSGVAQLAGVQRPVVSMWRSRYAGSDDPFPAPRHLEPMRFDRVEVGEWLDRTGRGNNRDARDESALHSSAFEVVMSDLDLASALLLIHELGGGPIGELDLAAAVEDLEARGLGGLVPPRLLDDVRRRADLVRTLDLLAEAAFSGVAVLDRLLDRLLLPDGAWAGVSLTVEAQQLLGRILDAVARTRPLVVDPVGSGGLLLAGRLLNRVDEGEMPLVAQPDLSSTEPHDCAAWRRLAARGAELEPSRQTPGARLRLALSDVRQSGDDFFDSIEQLLLEHGPEDVLVVVGPARLMVDTPGDGSRRRLLAPIESYDAPLRYVSRLPRGLSRYGGRRRLALWVFGGSSSTWTVVGRHAERRLTLSACDAVSADVATSLSAERDVRAHAFLDSAVIDTHRLLRRSTLTAPTGAAIHQVPVSGGERLARVWELDGSSPQSRLVDLDLAASSAQPALLTFDHARRGLGRDLAGVRIDPAHLSPFMPRTAPVIGPADVRRGDLASSVGIDRLLLEEVAPRARLTMPGDVVYVASGGPAAVVDRAGGHVVLAPARVFRCLDAERDDRQLVPDVVAADIAAQRGRDRSTWLLRAVPVDRVAAMTRLLARTATRRAELQAEIERVQALEAELLDALADGSLTAPIP